MRWSIRRSMQDLWRLSPVAIVLAVFLTSGCVSPENALEEREQASRAGLGFEERVRASSECSVRADPYYQRSQGDAVVLRTQVEIWESPSGKDRWKAAMDVIWHTWPEHIGPLGSPSGESPGDEKTHDHWVSTPGRSLSIHDELVLSWDHEDFALDGTYAATVTVDLRHQVQADGEWKTVCHQSREVNAKVVWEGNR